MNCSRTWNHPEPSLIWTIKTVLGIKPVTTPDFILFITHRELLFFSFLLKLYPVTFASNQRFHWDSDGVKKKNTRSPRVIRTWNWWFQFFICDRFTSSQKIWIFVNSRNDSSVKKISLFIWVFISTSTEMEFLFCALIVTKYKYNICLNIYIHICFFLFLQSFVFCFSTEMICIFSCCSETSNF